MSLKKDIIGAEVQIGSNEAQKSLVDLAQKTSALTNENDRLRISQAKLKALGKEHKQEYDQVTKAITENNKSIKENKAQMDALHKTLGISNMSMKQLTKQSQDLKREIHGMVEKDDPERWSRLNTELAATKRQMSIVGSQIGETRGFMGQLGNSLTSIPGPVGAVIQSIFGMGKALWALVANPVGATIAAIVVSLMLLYKAFTSTDDGAVKMEGTMKAIGNVMDILIDRAMSYYKMLWSLVTFDWEGVKANAKDAFGGIGSAIKDATAAGWEYAKSMDDIDDREAAAQIRMSKLKVEIETLKNASKDSMKTTKEKMDLAQQAMDKEIELNSIEKGFLQERGDVETMNLASKIQNSKLTMAQKEAQLKQWLSVDDKELASLSKKDAAFADFVDKNEEAFQALQKQKAEEFDKDAEFQTETRRLQKQLSADKKAMIEEDKKATDDARKKRIESLEAANSSEMGLIKKRFLEGKTTEDQYNAELLIQEMKFLSDKANVYKVGSKEYEEAQMQLLEKQVQAEKTVKDLILQANKELANAKIENLKDGIAKEKAKEEQRWQEELAGLKKQLNDKQDLSADEISLNDILNKTIEEKTREHNKVIADIDKAEEIRKNEKIAEKFGNVEQFDNQIPFVSIDLLQQYFDNRKSLLEQQYEFEKNAAGDNAKLITQIEEKYADKRKQLSENEAQAVFDITSRKIEIGQAYLGALGQIFGQETALGKALFLFSQALAIADVWVKTAASNAAIYATALAEFAWLGPGAPAAATAFAAAPIAANNTMAALQTGLIAAQTVANFVSGSKGKKAGGYTDRAATDDKIVDFVHSNEFVANAKAVRNPTVKPFLDVIKLAQEQGTIATLNLPAVMGSGGLQSGGYSSPPSSGSNVSNLIPGSSLSGIPFEQLKRFNDIMDRLDKNGIKASINKYGTNGVEEALADIADFKSKVFKP